MESKRKLYVDGLNFSSNFGFRTRAWGLTFPMQQITKFVESLRAEGWEPTIFIDAGIESGEALTKWKSRRETEVETCQRDVPPCLSSLMGEIFKLHGVKVYYSPYYADNDDCIAKFAQENGADVLSNDIDMARYVGRKYQIYGSFKYADGKIVLVPKKIDESRLPAPRNFIYHEVRMIESNPGFVSLFAINLLQRGSPSFLTKYEGNLHSYLEKFRLQLYRKLNLHNVKEVYPSYEDGRVVWIEKDFNTEDIGNGHLDERWDIGVGDEMLEAIQNGTRGKTDDIMPLLSEAERWNLSMCKILVVAELMSMYNSSPFLDEFRKITSESNFAVRTIPDESQFREVTPDVCRNWKETGGCSFAERCFASSGHFNCTCFRGNLCKFRHV